MAVATRVSRHGDAIRDAGLRLLPIDFSRSSLNPWRELHSLSALVTLYKREAPDLVHNVSVKPVVYGALAARRAGVGGIVNALMGLGWVFSSDSAKARALRPLIKRSVARFALRRQHAHDRAERR